jgi:hypothetical protein
MPKTLQYYEHALWYKGVLRVLSVESYRPLELSDSL